MKFSPQIHLFLCLAMLGNMLAPAIVRADPPLSNTVCPRINTPEAKLDEKVRNSNRNKLFHSWRNAMIKDFSRQHRSIKYISKTQPALNAQLGFMKTLTENVTVICEAQVTAENGIATLATKLNQPGKEMCGRFQEIETFYGKANEGVTFLTTTTEESLKKIRAGHIEGANINRSKLDEMDMMGIDTKERAPLVTFPHSTGPELDPNAKIQTASTPYRSLREELGTIWGANLTTSKGQQAADFKPDANSFYGGVLRRLETESTRLKTLQEKFAREKSKMGSQRNDCVAAGFEMPPSTVADTASATPDVSGLPEENPFSTTEEQPVVTGENPQKDADLGAQPPATVATDNTPVDTTIPTDTTDTNPPLVDPTDNRTYVPPYVPPKDEQLGTLPPPRKVEEEGWISRNKGLLLTVGVGAAAVGGILWYKKSQDKKAEQDAALLEMEAQAMVSANANSNSSGSSSTSTGTDSTVGGTPANVATPQGSKLVISGIPSGSVTVGEKIPEITVAIINPTGILTQDSHSEIIVSCVQPAGCSLSGTGQAQTSAGKAKFNDLRFTQAHEGVRLLFTSPGFESVMSVPFSVIGGAGGDTSTITDTATSTFTDTSTTTTTNTNTSTSTHTGGPRE